VVAFNKMDIPEASDRWNNFQAYLERKGIEALCMSAATKKGTESVVMKAFSLLQSLPKIPVEYTTGINLSVAL
jgi:GTP-binding protein